MDEQHQQPAHVAPVAPVGGHAPVAPVERFPAPAPGGARRYGRLVLRGLVYSGIRGWELLRPRWGWVLTVVLLSGLACFQGLLLLAGWLSSANMADTRVANLPPPAAIQSFLDGQASYDADKMWESLSPSLQSAFTENGGSKETMAAHAQSERAAGQRYRGASYIGGVALQGDLWRYFYIVDVESPAPERDGPITFIFTTGRDGKIVDLKTIGQ